MLRPSSVYRRIPGFRRVKKAWRSRGFGIHSPFAFRFISRVLRERGEYYAYGELRRLAGSQRRFRELSLLFRLVCHFRPAAVRVVGEPDEGVRGAVRLADSGAVLIEERDRANGSNRSDGADGTDGVWLMVIFEDAPLADGGLVDEALEVLERGGGVVCRDVDAGMLAGLKSRLENGMTFTNGHLTVLVGRHDLPRQDFELNF